MQSNSDPNRVEFEVNQGDALARMQMIAQSLYQTTPELERDIPMDKSKILGSVVNKSAGGVMNQLQESKKKAKKDELSMYDLHRTASKIEMNAQDIENEYNIAVERQQKEKERCTELKKQLINKQERYIKREQEYRKTIEEIQGQIEFKSKSPFVRGRQESPEVQKSIELVSAKRTSYINETYDKIMDAIEKIQRCTARSLQNQREEICKVLDQKLESIKKQIKDEQQKKGENTADFRERENEINDHLETMTQIAQKIDNENRELIKKNTDLTIEFKSQEEDRKLLLQQLIQQKKENEKNKQKLNQMKSIADELEKKEKDNELADGVMNRPSARPSTTGKNGRRVSSKQSLRHEVGSSLPSMKFQQRAMTSTATNPKLSRYVAVIQKIKKMIMLEKNNLRQARTLYSQEIEQKTRLEQLLRMCVDDVKSEIAKKRSENKVMYYGGKRSKTGDIDLTQQEREKIIEVLLSQERVLTLLYDKTFPPRSMGKQVSGTAYGGFGGLAGKMDFGNVEEEYDEGEDDEMTEAQVDLRNEL